MTWAPGELPEVDRQELQEPKTQRQVIYTRGRFFSFVRKQAEKKSTMVKIPIKCYKIICNICPYVYIL